MRCLVNESFVPATQRILLKIVGFLISIGIKGDIVHILPFENAEVYPSVYVKYDFVHA